MQIPQRLHVYQDATADSTRWDGFRPRAGDIVVCTPPKCGTTWAQMLCAMLVHDSPVLPRPLTQMSRWLESRRVPVEQLLADLEAQPGPRIVKSHTPLDGLPWFEEVRYVFCGHDPRDAYLSMIDHLQNLSEAALAEIRRHGDIPDGAAMPRDPNVLFPMWATVGRVPWMYDGGPFPSVIAFTETYWRFRRLPNLLFLHYRDLTEDLEGEFRRLAAFLGYDIDSARWPEFLQAASFAAMKERADDVAPDADLDTWRSNAAFFRSARIGQWRQVLTPENQALYEEVNRQRLPPAMKAWLEGGRGAAGDPREAD